MKQYCSLCIIVILSFLFCIGLYDNIIKHQHNKCEMTYMFEYPQYKEVQVLGNHKSNYKLYIYGEGQYFRMITKEKFSGIPVLFIPGNQGSFRQVRSLASVALRKAQNKYPFHFNYFTVDFNEEIGALFGPALERQTQFISLAIKTILELYKYLPNKPQSVVIVGHSIGGFVARAVVMQDDLSKMVSSIITFATPHLRPVLIPDSSLLAFYEKVNNLWASETLKVKDIAVVTIGGGRNDILVPSTFTTTPHADIDETLLSVPECWLTTDHLAIVWCKQLVLAVTRALFDVVDRSTAQIFSEKKAIVNAFKNHLSEKRETFQSSLPVEELIKQRIKEKEDWIYVSRLHHIQKFYRNSRVKALAINLTLDPLRQHLSLLYNGLASTLTLIICRADVTNDVLSCLNGKSLHTYIRSIPGNMKKANVDLSVFGDAEFNYVITLVNPIGYMASLELDLSSGDSRCFDVEVPPFFSSFSPLLVTESTPLGALGVNLTLKGFSEFWQSFTLSLRQTHRLCSLEDDHPVVSFRSSWRNNWEYVPVVESRHDFNLAVDVPSPAADEGFVEVQIHKNSSCDYSVSLQKNVRGMVQRVSLLNVGQVPAYVVCHLLLALANQYKTTFTGGTTTYHLMSLSPVIVIPFAKLGAYGFSQITSIETNWSYLEKNRMNIQVMPIMLFLATLPLTVLAYFILRGLIITLSYGAFFTFARNHNIVLNDEKGIHHGFYSYIWSFPSLTAIVLLILGIVTFGTLPLLVATGISLIKVVKIHIKKLQQTETFNTAFYERSFDYHLMLTLLLLVAAVITIPTFISWTKTVWSLEWWQSDPSLFVYIVIILSLSVLWQVKPTTKRKQHKLCGYLIHCNAVLVLLFGTVSIFRLNDLISYTFFIMAMNQLFYW